jgi:bacterioferritin-associated ferredoxin
MYVCVCHGYREACVTKAVDSGPASVSDVYRCLGEQPRCGKCVPDVLRIFQDRRGNEPDREASAAAASI